MPVKSCIIPTPKNTSASIKILVRGRVSQTDFLQQSILQMWYSAFLPAKNPLKSEKGFGQTHFGQQ
jgi:hypothetical protein